MTNATMLVSLLQPQAEVFNLFDDVIFLESGRVLYHGPKDSITPFFQSFGFQKMPGIDPATFFSELCNPGKRAFHDNFFILLHFSMQLVLRRWKRDFFCSVMYSGSDSCCNTQPFGKTWDFKCPRVFGGNSQGGRCEIFGPSLGNGRSLLVIRAS